MEIIEEVMEKYSSTKIWNMSLGIESKVCDGSMSDLGIFLDYIQDKYSVQFFVSSGNLNQLPLREWPPQDDMGERDRIISPADSVRAITVGSVALYESKDSIVRSNEPSPFSRRGPGANYIVKPDVVDYGGNISRSLSINGLAMKGLDVNGKIVEGNGTSYQHTGGSAAAGSRSSGVEEVPLSDRSSFWSDGEGAEALWSAIPPHAVRVQSSVKAVRAAKICFIPSCLLGLFGSHGAGNPAAEAGAP